MAADHSLATPLLPDHTCITISTLSQSTNPNSHNSQKLQNSQNYENGLYALLGAEDGYRVPDTSRIDPFRNHTREIEGVYEWVKMVLCLPIAVLRFGLFLVCLFVGYFGTLLALLGWKGKDGGTPLPKWRCGIMWITRLAARGILFSFGYVFVDLRFF